MSREVRRLRRARDWTQAELAERAGISRQSLNVIEKGGTPSLRTALALARELETRAAELFPDQDASAAAWLEERTRMESQNGTAGA